ncbi:DUF948 domain-containing protein [Metabacillus arenae]|uniref:DUF948 domain-containing protein n=1 Tax=Metabacillus arenae TaxID=2771434 RepID=A0A926N9S7_9BACI|nr:DUF948 domain-containing protein [Metabacillus arenae]MBD1380152.1 DUF948 domain-containing protein [Metabacillus arenae]
MIVVLYLSVALIAIAFTVLVVYLSKTLHSLNVTLTNVAGTLEGLEKQMQGITIETTDLLHKTNQLAEDIQHKSDRLNTVVAAVQDVGTSLQRFNQSVQKVSTTVSTNLEQNQDKISQVVQWGNTAMEIWEKWKMKKQKPETPLKDQI